MAEQRCSVARWDSVVSRLSLLPGNICPTLRRDGNGWIYFLAPLHRVNVSRNATKRSCLWGGNIYGSGRFCWSS